MKINQVEQSVGITKKNIRFYEQEGLLSPMRNSENGYREYSDEDVTRLKQIKLLRKLSVPIEVIRKMQQGALGAADGMRRHVTYLEDEMRNLTHATQLCQKISESGDELDALDIDGYLAEMERMESEGVSFVNIRKNDIVKKMVAPVVITVVTVALMLGIIYLLLRSTAGAGIPLAVKALFIVIPLAVAGGVIASMLQRVREIKGGEEDAAGKY